MDRVTLIDVNTTGSNITRIECPAFFTDAIGFNAIGLAESMRSASDIFTGRFALNTGWSANKSCKAVTLERTRSVDTLSVGSADTRSCSTLIDI